MLSSIEIHGGQVVYDLIGPTDGTPVVLTPGGRFDMNIPGLRPLAERLVAEGMRVLLWDRPNSGSSDVQFWGRSESHMRAEVLSELLRRLDLAPAVLAGGSSGARDSLITVIEHPEVASGLVMWNVSGGNFALLRLGGLYIINPLVALNEKGVDGLAELPHWRGLIETKPGNLDRLRELGPGSLREVLMRWLDAYVPKPGQTIPGLLDQELEGITTPTLIIRGGERDLDHPKRTSLEVGCLIRGSVVADPPWPEDAWERHVEAAARGKGHVFDYWPLAAPLITEFVRKSLTDSD
ncbi:alpha/beta fold hydrolase [Streptomyces sp. NBC_00582]|uniref:alpha/beta fold hydrolase n=1 Tax=Streptomyces sp. NBC_00582 TaxID=2975783 RepID=UPI002E818C66|nr:alpha/beta hydrolase [Streptomyces sp. NBC_00582]WUB66059.1 alpha/beta hydrolase [Streptomyces sp. NBC_00582]